MTSAILRRFLPLLLALLAFSARAQDRPNIVLCIADDWGWPWAGAYGDPVVKTPAFDRVAREGALFTHAFVSSPSCTPSRGALLTGKHFWRLEENANLHSTMPPKFTTYPDALAKAGYFTGQNGKSWGPGRELAGGRTSPAAGKRFKSFEDFLAARPKDQPFCFWQGSGDPHRPHEWQSGLKSGMDISKVKLPSFYPDTETVRTDVADYLWEVQRFDSLVAKVLAALEAAGELDNTIVVVTGDHGIPFPRGKCNLYDLGVRVPLAVRWGAKIKAGQTIDALVSLIDLAPTFYDAAGLPPGEFDGRTLLDLIAGRPDAKPWRDHLVFGRERHTLAQGGGSLLAYPARAIRTKDHLLIWNMKPDRWPVGVAPEFRDCDGGPTKDAIVEHVTTPEAKRYFALSFGQRPEEELYDVGKDPDQVTNLAGERSADAVRAKLKAQLKAELEATKDPRVVGGGEKFDEYPYYGNKNGFSGKKPPQPAIQ